jgi:hypothetical protein
VETRLIDWVRVQADYRLTVLVPLTQPTWFAFASIIADALAMSKRYSLLAAALTIWANTALAQDFPVWERLLRHYSGKTDETPVPSMKMGRHMQMSLKGDPAPGDAARAAEILAAADAVLSRYHDVKTAVHDGYKPFFPTGRMGEEIHYTNYRYRRKEQQHVDYSRPGSLLYKRTAEGLKAIGVMYTAPTDATPQQLDAIAPLSIATWHRHVDFCGGPKTLPAS